MASQTSAPRGEYLPTADQRIVTRGVPWSHFEKQLALRGDRSGPRIAFLDGALYQKVERSAVFPDLDVNRLCTFLGHPTAMQAVKAFRKTLRPHK